MKASAMYGTIIRYVMTAVIAIVAAMPSAAQEGNRHDDSISDLIIEGLKGTESFIENTLDSKDSVYISPNLYNMTIMPQYSYCYDY